MLVGQSMTASQQVSIFVFTPIPLLSKGCLTSVFLAFPVEQRSGVVFCSGLVLFLDVDFKPYLGHFTKQRKWFLL